jgi:spermidine synthase
MPPLAAGALVFFTSAAVLVLEILAARLLAPYVGVTLETYTGIIGTVLAAISVGTWLGGRLADRVDPRATLGPLLIGGGALALCTVPFIRLVGSANLGTGPLAVVTLAFIGFFAPAAVLSAVSPTVVKLQLSNLAETGRTVGRLSALGTAGAILGTFVTGFVLLAALPTTPIVISVGATLLVVGLLVLATSRRIARTPPQTGPVALALVLAVPGAYLSATMPNPCEVESAYFCGAVVEDLPPCGGRTLYLDRLRHSCVHLDDPEQLDFSYAQIMSDVVASLAPAGEPIDALHIGGGGFTMPRYINAVRPGSRNLVLELDPTLVEVARDHLGLETSDGLQVRTGDARVSLNDVSERSYDLVIGDAFGGQAVPWHLTTREFVTEIHRRLRPGGVYAINLIDYPPLGFARAEAATLLDVFDHVAVVGPPERLERREGGNFVLVASDEPIDVEAILAANAARGDDDAAIIDGDVHSFVDGAPVLTDDYAPVDQLLNPATG